MTKTYQITEDDYKDYPSEFYEGKPYENCILPIEMIDKFVCRVSNIDLKLYIKKIIKYRSNIKPEGTNL